MKRVTIPILVVCALWMAAAMTVHAAPQTTAFAYQGQLSAGGNLPVGQTYQFTFTLYDAATAGNVVGAPIQQALLVGNGGLFTTDLDFGQIFDDQQNWLEVRVGTTIGNQQPLAARQLIGTIPVAQYAMNSRSRDFADFFALMPPDNAATVAPGTDVQFPQDGPSSGNISRVSSTQFNLSAIGTYQVMFQVSVSEAAQLVIALNGIEQSSTLVGRATGTSQLVGIAVIQTTQGNSILSIRNPAGGVSAFSITPLAGGTRPVSAHLVITRMD